jgi:ribonuclease HII
MTEKEREKSYEEIVNNSDILWEVCVVSHTEIDEINILQASLIGMKRSCETLLDRMSADNKVPKFKSSKCLALVDGNKTPQNMPINTVSVIKGDSLIYSIALASILAKVTRDRIMREYSIEYPQYNFSQHKGYPTLEHRRILHEIGPCPIHRVSYGPVKLAIQAMAERSETSRGMSSTVDNAKDSKAVANSSSLHLRAASSTRTVQKTRKKILSKSRGVVRKKSAEVFGLTSDIELRRSDRLRSQR